MMISRQIERQHHLRVDLLVIIGLAIVLVLTPAYRSLKEGRLYRDIMGLTPFSAVQVYGTVVEASGIYIKGEMIKERCTFAGLVGYITLESGLSHRVPVDTSIEDERGVVGNRPVSGRSEAWGPWKLWYSGGLGPAQSWDIYAKHKDCETGPETQSNLFASGKWDTTVNGE